MKNHEKIIAMHYTWKATTDYAYLSNIV